MNLKSIFFVLIFLVSLVLQNIRLTEIKVEFDRLNKKKHNLLEDSGKLQLKTSNLAAAARIEHLAHQKLRLKYIERSDLVPILILPEYRERAGKEVIDDPGKTFFGKVLSVVDDFLE